VSIPGYGKSYQSLPIRASFNSICGKWL